MPGHAGPPPGTPKHGGSAPPLPGAQHAGRSRRPPEHATGYRSAPPPPLPPRPRPTRGAGHRRWRQLIIVARAFVALGAIVVLVGTGLGWKVYHGVAAGLTQSSALVGAPVSVGKNMNILIMGLDSRLDEKGNPLPAEIYNQLHAGDGTVGGYNSNVLMVLHIPGDGSKATAISIPRDDYVDLDGCGDGCKGKIKEAYGRAFAKERDQLVSEGVSDQVSLEAQGREAGRKAEIHTVQNFLGGIPIDQFVEVTLVAFFQIAEVVQPIEVCVNEDTSDSYSGAKFHKGVQWISGRQAVAFVRQRRDPDSDLNFTDLDRDRRQQAFLISLSKKLSEDGTLTNLTKLQGILNVAKANIAVEVNPDIAMLAKTATRLTGGNVTFFTLPVSDFGKTPDGEDVNLVDLDTIHAIVKHLIGPNTSDSSAAATSTPPVPDVIANANGITINVVNSSGQAGIAGAMTKALAAHGFTKGDATSGSEHSDSTIEYGSGAQNAAQQLGGVLGITDSSSDTDLPDNSVRLTIGTDFTPPAGLLPPGATDDASTTTTTQAAIPTAVDATGVGANAPSPTDLSTLGGAGVPCVK